MSAESDKPQNRSREDAGGQASTSRGRGESWWARWLKVIVPALVGASIGAFVTIAIDQCWLGLGPCDRTPDVRIDTASSRFNAPGDDNPADEYVCLVNSEDDPVDLTGWQLREGNGHLANTLPSFALAPSAGVRVHPGRGSDSARDLFGDHGAPVWTNGGDSVILVDSDEQVIARASYGNSEESDPVANCKA
jgi:hypothetical protein